MPCHFAPLNSWCLSVANHIEHLPRYVVALPDDQAAAHSDAATCDIMALYRLVQHVKTIHRKIRISITTVSIGQLSHDPSQSMHVLVFTTHESQPVFGQIRQLITTPNFLLKRNMPIN